MANLQRNAEELASKGRYGDNRLLHVSDVELAGLASLIPGGKLPTNPDTGLPEAFFFLPFLFGAAPAAAGATAAAAPALAAGTAAGAGALGAGMTAGMEAATMGGLAGAGTAAAAAPTIAGTGAMGLGAVTPTLAETGLAAAAPAATTAAPTIAGTGALGTGAVTPTLAEAGLSATSPAVAGGGLTAAGAADAGAGAGLGGLLGGMNPMMAMAPLAMMMGQGGGGGGDSEKPDISNVRYKGGEPKFPDKGYRGGIDPEFRYFQPVSYLRDGGLVKKRMGYADGGLAAIDQEGMGQMPMPEGMEGGVSDTSREDAMLIEATVAAIRGQVPNADAILQQFLQRFGEQALQDLVMRVQQLPQGGGQPSDGRSDSIPANLSEGEYIVPADVVSGMGRGSTEAGARQLDQMSNQVRNMNQGGLMY